MCSALFSVFRSLMAALSFRVCEYVLLCCNQHSPRQGVIVVRSQEHVTQIQGPLPRSRAWENYLLSCRPAFIICNVEGGAGSWDLLGESNQKRRRILRTAPGRGHCRGQDNHPASFQYSGDVFLGVLSIPILPLLLLKRGSCYAYTERQINGLRHD